MRETPGFSVRPTVKESMLTTRRRKRETTRFNAPGKSSTCTMKVCAFRSGVIRRLLDGRRPADHVVQVRSRGDHRVDAVLGLDAEVDHHRARLLLRALDRVREVRAPIDAQPAQPVSFGK